MPLDSDDGFYADASIASFIVEQILDINRIDDGIDPEEREPIRLYINSPGGDVTEGFALISAIEISKTPVYTINMGQWSSMAFLIGIAGHKRFSLPKASFLMHDGSIFLYGSANKVKDRVEFENRFENEVVKPFVLAHSKMLEEDYDKYVRLFLYFFVRF
ncbi:ATP-dependent Clp protease proteolytic subunit [Candidatus Saccharibacteria bacterium]|nr:ATP-dependent Clp protease proteolytic subunit [Candidatus Saccharibacteria bacterium]